ncbi:hypothetical protein [Massilia sp. BJB1822]|uniref:hypothetical protein n=1 Tax=Massilia sp. BJB1822 TaxID=2744470 RepID=UPI0015942B0C|nr:hypothetical protein [Massilia sp. BJB1822]NVE01718.1 hypothetical protein [Massilia sp. BJB1822]
MAAATFDAHQYARRLIDAGFSSSQADVLAETTGEIMLEITSVATAVEKLECKMTAEFEKQRAYIDQRLAEQRQAMAEQAQSMMRWILVVGASFGLIQTGLLTAIVVKLLF